MRIYLNDALYMRVYRRNNSFGIECRDALLSMPSPIFRANFKCDKVDYSGCVTEGTCKVVSINLGIFSTAPRRFEHCNLTRRALSYQQMETEGCIQKPALGFHMQMI